MIGRISLLGLVVAISGPGVGDGGGDGVGGVVASSVSNRACWSGGESSGEDSVLIVSSVNCSV